MTLYIKTDGPIPEGCDYITAGKVYAAAPDDYNPETCRLFWVVGDTGDRILVSPGRPCPHLAAASKWHFCDSTGSPVAAPWEEAKPTPIDWQAHAEALAKALYEAERQMVGDAISAENEYGEGREIDEIEAAQDLPYPVYLARATLLAFSQAKGVRPCQGIKRDQVCKCDLAGVNPVCGRDFEPDETDCCRNVLDEGYTCWHEKECHQPATQGEGGA